MSAPDDPQQTHRFGQTPPRRTDRRLLKFLLTNAAFGVGVGWVLLAAIYAFDIAGIKTLSRQTDAGMAALYLLGVGFAVTFGSLAMATAVWLMPKDDDDDGPGGGRLVGPAQSLAPVRVSSRAR